MTCFYFKSIVNITLKIRFLLVVVPSVLVFDEQYGHQYGLVAVYWILIECLGPWKPQFSIYFQQILQISLFSLMVGWMPQVKCQWLVTVFCFMFELIYWKWVNRRNPWGIVLLNQCCCDSDIAEFRAQIIMHLILVENLTCR